MIAKGKVTARDIWEQVEQRVGSQTWIAGDSFSVADLYLTVFWTWGRGPVLGYDMPADFPHGRRMPAASPSARLSGVSSSGTGSFCLDRHVIRSGFVRRDFSR